MLNKIDSIKFQFQETLLVSGVVLYGFCDKTTMGTVLVVLAIFGAFMRTGFEIAEKSKVAEKKEEEMSKIKDATSAILDGFQSGMKGGK